MFSKADIEKYFIAEKQLGLLFIIIGIAAIASAVCFFFLGKTSFHKGIAVVFFITGFAIGAVAYKMYKKSDVDRVRNVYAYDMNPSLLKEQELPRMQMVLKNFTMIKWTEILLLAAGIFLFYYFAKGGRYEFWRGAGLAISIMALLALATDTIAASRAKNYYNGLQSFTNNK